MTDLDAAVRESILWSLRVLSELDGVEGRNKIIAFDNATVSLDPVMDLDDAKEMVGEVLRDHEEARALNDVRAALRSLYDLHGGQASDAQIVGHPYFLAIVCTAAYALEIMTLSEAIAQLP